MFPSITFPLIVYDPSSSHFESSILFISTTGKLSILSNPVFWSLFAGGSSSGIPEIGESSSFLFKSSVFKVILIGIPLLISSLVQLSPAVIVVFVITQSTFNSSGVVSSNLLKLLVWFTITLIGINLWFVKTLKSGPSLLSLNNPKKKFTFLPIGLNFDNFQNENLLGPLFIFLLAFSNLISLKFLHSNGTVKSFLLFLFFMKNISLCLFLTILSSIVIVWVDLNSFCTLQTISTSLPSSVLFTSFTLHLSLEDGNDKGSINIFSFSIGDEGFTLNPNFPLLLQSNVSFISCISKVGGKVILFSSKE